MATVTQVEKGCEYKGEKRMGIYNRISIFGEGLETVPVLLERKKCHPRIKKTRGNCYSFQVESLGEGDYNGFELDGNGRFLLGDFTVTHNSCLIQKLIDDKFVATDDPTIEDIHSTTIYCEDEKINLEILDTSGMDTQSHLYERWFSKVDGFVIVYSVAAAYSFDMVPVFRDLISEFHTKTNKPPMLIVGTQSDSASREIPTKFGTALAFNYSCPFVELSAKSSTQVELQNAMATLVAQIRSVEREQQVLLVNQYEELKKKKKELIRALVLMNESKKKREISSWN